jgi:hypothetical protein
VLRAYGLGWPGHCYEKENCNGKESRKIELHSVLLPRGYCMSHVTSHCYTLVGEHHLRLVALATATDRAAAVQHGPPRAILHHAFLRARASGRPMSHSGEARRAHRHPQRCPKTIATKVTSGLTTASHNRNTERRAQFAVIGVARRDECSD